MKLSAIFATDMFFPVEWDRNIKHLVTDTRDVTAGDVFICRINDGARSEQYIKEAIESGAVAVLAEGNAGFKSQSNIAQNNVVPIFYFSEINTRIPSWCQRRYQNINQLTIFGVTGTNGKSSVTQYIAQILAHLGTRCGVLGTLGNGVWPNLKVSRNTTPDIAIVYRYLSDMADEGINYVAMEVSSHGIDQGRVEGLIFDHLIYTNITHDHLDYHGSFEAYAECKKSLMQSCVVKSVLINGDDATLQSWMPLEDVLARTYGVDSRHDIQIDQVQPSDYGMTAYMSSPWGDALIDLPLVGAFNIHNAVAAISVIAAAGFEFNAILSAIEYLAPADGRMELYRDSRGALAVIDFAHTPDALKNVLSALSFWKRPIATVFGCGGERDPLKRPLMGKIATELSDYVWLTDDNPRNEDPDKIFNDVLMINSNHEIHAIHDRKQAISSAIASVDENTILVIAGKGHENYQEIKGEKIKYSDKSVLEEFGFQPVFHFKNKQESIIDNVAVNAENTEGKL